MNPWWTRVLGAALLAFSTAHVCLGSEAPRSTAASSALSREIMSPFCPGMTLATCPSEAATHLRSEIADRLSAGEDADQSTRSLEDRYGMCLRGSPDHRGWGLAIWVVPGLLGLPMLQVLFMAAGLRVSGPQALASEVTTADPKLLARLEADLDRLD